VIFGLLERKSSKIAIKIGQKNIRQREQAIEKITGED